MGGEPQDLRVPAIQSASDSLTVRMQEREVMVYSVFESELSNISEASTDMSLNLGFLTFLLGAVVSILIVLSTVAGALSTRAFAAYCASLVACIVLAIFFGTKTALAWRKRRDVLDQIRSKAAPTES